MTSKIDALNERFKKQYVEAESKFHWHGLVVGEKAIGKTSLIRSLPKPVFVFSFDPAGMDTVKDLVESGDVVFEDYAESSMDNPTTWDKFTKDWNDMAVSGFLAQFASVVFDSTSTMHIAAQWSICKHQGHVIPKDGTFNPGKHGMLMSDWQTILQWFIEYTTKINMLPCHTLILGHIGKDQDSVTGKFVTQLSLQGAARDRVPFLTSEVYYMMRAQKSGEGYAKGDRVLVTESVDVAAGTRLGARGKLPSIISAMDEGETMRGIFKACGLKHEDKENFLK